jgi:hypothetical protein
MIGLFSVHFYVVLGVSNVLALTLPGVAIALSADGDFHAILEGGVSLEKVQDVETDFS